MANGTDRRRGATRASLWLTAACVAAALACGARDARAQTAALISGLGGAADFGTNSVPPEDDMSSPPIDVSMAFPSGLAFNGQTFTSVFVNINGNISFGTALADFTPRAFPGAAAPMVAAWWADVDTRNADPDAGVGPDAGGVYWSLESGRLVATWYQVGYFDRHRDLLNSFQIVIRDAGATGRPGDFDIELRYNRCEWTTGDASGGDGGVGGAIARGGYDGTAVPGGSMTAFHTLPGSGAPEILDLCTTSNVGEPGVWRLQVRAGAVAFCGDNAVDPGEECDGTAAPPGFGCTIECTLCDGDASACPGGGDAGMPDVATDAAVDVPVELPDAADAGTDAALPPDVAMDVMVRPDVVVPPDVAMDVVVPPDVVMDVVVPPDVGTDVMVPPDVALDAAVDARTDTGADAALDVTPDVAMDVAMDAGTDAGTDASMDAPEAAPDTGRSVERYGGGGLFSCAVVGAPAGSRTPWGLLAPIAAVLLLRRRRRRGRSDDARDDTAATRRDDHTRRDVP